MALKRICAWCQADLGELESPHSGITHGICRSCQVLLRSEFYLQASHLEMGLILRKDDFGVCLTNGNRIIARFTNPVSRISVLHEANRYLLQQQSLPYQSH